MSRWFPLFGTVLLTLSFPSALAAQDTKDAADALVRRLRTEHFDGDAYGSVLQTCRVLDALSRSPRRYNELDGPFFRRAAERVADASGGREREAWKALALAGAITARLTAERDRALNAVRTDAPGARYESALALATLDARALEAVRATVTVPGADAGLAVLLADDPSSVPPPALQPVRGWVDWARAARLRGLDIVVRPPLPEPGPDAGLDELIDALNVVILLHGLPTDDGGPPSGMGDGPPPLPERVPPGHDVEAALTLAWDYLEGLQDGGRFGLDLPFWDGPQAGITALNLSASLYLAERLGRSRPDWIDAGLDWLVDQQHADGSIHQGGLAVYTTSVAVGALVDGGRPGDRRAIERAREFLEAAQSDEGEGYSSHDDPHYGGIGYGGDERPDLSNTQMALEAAARAGTPPDAPLFRKARGFLERNQNDAESGSIDLPRAEGGRLVSGQDGGGTYMPGNSPAGEDPAGTDTWVARSYGSMTYALTKSYLLCGLRPGDRRLDAAVRWLADHYTLETNPGFEDPDQGAQGLYYYYLAMATTLERLPDGALATSAGQAIPWRGDLTRKLVDEQRTTGSWINDRAGRWWESSPALCTGYAILALRAADS